MHSLMKIMIVLYCLLFNTLLSFANEAPRTDVETCDRLAQEINGQAFASLFEKASQIKLETRPNYFSSFGGSGILNGCYITIHATPTDTKNHQWIGSILVYHQSNSFNLYQAAKQQFANSDYVLYQQPALPFIVEGFVDKTLPTESTFNTYLNNQYYLILMLKPDVEGTPKSTITNITPTFMQFINIATQQIANSQQL